MAIPSTGSLSLDDIQTEFGGTNPISLSEYYAGGGLVQSGATGDSGAIPTSGQISIGQFYGSTARVPIVINNTGTTLRADIYALASANPTYSAGITDVVYNNSGTLYSNATNAASLRTGTFASGDTVKIVNTGLIIGKGGNGGAGSVFPTPQVGGTGGAGGRALALQFPVTIDNTGGTIAGGGGGGAGGDLTTWTVPHPSGPKYPPQPRSAGGSGGGGGAGKNIGTGGAGGSGGVTYAGNAGSNGTNTAGGAGGAAVPFIPTPLKPFAKGGNGGGRGQAGSPVVSPSGTAAGGAAGQAIISNGNSITWVATGTINGPTT